MRLAVKTVLLKLVESHLPQSNLTGAVSGENASTELIQQLPQLVQTQTAMVAAQTRAMSVKSLPPIPT